MPSSWQKVVYTPPICIKIRLPFVSRCFCKSIRVRGRWNTPQKTVFWQFFSCTSVIWGVKSVTPNGVVLGEGAHRRHFKREPYEIPPPRGFAMIGVQVSDNRSVVRGTFCESSEGVGNVRGWGNPKGSLAKGGLAQKTPIPTAVRC